MKTKTKTKAEVVEVEVLEPDEVNFGEVLVLGNGEPAERIRRHIHAAAALGRLAFGHVIAAGWELYIQKIHTPYGEWQDWCSGTLGMSHKTADRYIAFFKLTLGAARQAAGRALENHIAKGELAAATVGIEATTVSGAMAELGIIKRNRNYGVAREGAGRPPAEADPAKDATRVWAVAADAFRRIPETSYRFLPLDEARGVLGELDAVRERLRARIRELTDAGKGDF